jgi:arsenite methyltransferase
MNHELEQTDRASESPEYGIDAPGLVRFFFLAGASSVAVLLMTIVFLGDRTWVGFGVGTLAAIAAIYLIGMGSLMLLWSKVTKVQERERTLDLIEWRGDERVLDVGCGRGLMIIGAALRLKTGRAVGVDIWATKDQSGNSPESARNNAIKAGVLDRIEIQTADMRKLPFADHSFDVVVSHWVVHNLENEADRNLALGEMVRVLRPGGRLILCDIEHRDAYLAKLTALGLANCRMIFEPMRDTILGALSFGSFRPTTIVAQARR